MSLHHWQTIDCHYLFPRFAAAFLRVESGRAVFIENNTTRALPFLLAALEAQNVSLDKVDYLMVTHAHLDHAGLDCNIRVVVSAQNQSIADAHLRNILESFSQYNFYQYGNMLS